jgi:hypothetical protein
MSTGGAGGSSSAYRSRIVVPEAPLRSTKFGLVPESDGWFILNARRSRWRDYGALGAACDFEGKRPFKQLGINLNILNPGEPMSMYHRENHQEGFLVLAGEYALEHGAGAAEETRKSAEAYARFPPSERSQYREGWLPDF